MKIYKNNDFNKNSFSKILPKLKDKYLTKNKKYSKYLSDKFIEEEFYKFCNTYDKECSINPQVLFGIYIQNKIIKRLVDFVNNGDIDLEIELIEQYTPTINFIIQKMNLNENIDKEEILILAIETYEGNKSFSLHIVDTIRNKLNKTSIQNTLDNNNLKQETQVETFKINEIKFEESIEKYTIDKEFKSKELSYIEKLFIKFNLIDTISNECLKKYITLKFGYYKGIYFTDKDISILLNISETSINNMYKEILYILKETINKDIDLIISYNFDISPHNKYIKVKEIN